MSVESTSLDSVTLLDAGEDPSLKILQDQVASMKGQISTLRSEQSSLQKRESVFKESSKGWDKDAEDSSARRTRAEAAVDDLTRQLIQAKSDSAREAHQLQGSINREVDSRRDSLQGHNERMKAKEKDMLDDISGLETQSERADKMLADNLSRVGNNRKKLEDMGDQVARLKDLGRESSEVADVLKHKYAGGLTKTEREISKQEKRIELEHARVPKVQARIEEVAKQATPLREKSKEMRAEVTLLPH